MPGCPYAEALAAAQAQSQLQAQLGLGSASASASASASLSASSPLLDSSALASASATAEGGWESPDGTETLASASAQSSWGDFSAPGEYSPDNTQLENAQLDISQLENAEQELQQPEQSSADVQAELNQVASEYANAPGSTAGDSKIIESKRPCKIVKKIEITKKAGETIIHKPAHIIVNQPPTKLIINHPPLIVKPSPVVLSHGGKTIQKQITHKYLPRPIHVRPVYVKVVKPIEKKVLIEKNKNEKPGCLNKIINGKLVEGPCQYSSGPSSSSSSTTTITAQSPSGSLDVVSIQQQQQPQPPAPSSPSLQLVSVQPGGPLVPSQSVPNQQLIAVQPSGGGPVQYIAIQPTAAQSAALQQAQIQLVSASSSASVQPNGQESVSVQASAVAESPNGQLLEANADFESEWSNNGNAVGDWESQQGDWESVDASPVEENVEDDGENEPLDPAIAPCLQK